MPLVEPTSRVINSTRARSGTTTGGDSLCLRQLAVNGNPMHSPGAALQTGRLVADKVGLLGVPSDSNSSFLPGARRGPEAIRKALHCESSNRFTESGIELVAGVNLTDCGDVEGLCERFDAQRIATAAESIMGHGHGLIALGGDHAVSAPLVAAAARVHGPLDILHIDAHPDLYEDFGGNPDSHASPFARILEQGNCRRLVQIGIRTMNTTQSRVADRYGVEVIPMSTRIDPSRLRFDRPVYLSLDLDGLDPAFAPGVSHPEPGGFSSRDVIDIIQQAAMRLVAADVVELNPDQDVRDLTARVAAKLVKELASRMLAG